MEKITNQMLLALTINGLNPRESNARSILLLVISYTSTSGMLLLNVLKLLLDWHGVETIGEAHLISSTIILSAKVTYMIIYKQNFLRLLNTSESFWKFNRFDKDSENKIGIIANRIINTLKFYFCMLFCTAITLSLGAFMKREIIFPGYDVCDLQYNPCYPLYFTWHLFYSYFEVVLIVFAFDGFFVCFIAYAFCGLEMIKEGLKKLIVVSKREQDDVPANYNLRAIINEHDKILRFIKELNEFYSPVMLLHSLSSLFSLIFCLFIITADGIPPKLPVLTKYGVLLLTVIIQFFIFCYAGAKILEQSTSMVDSFYDVDWWYKTQPNVRRALMFMIQRAQLTQKLKIGNMNDLNLESYLLVMRNGLSIFTIIRTMGMSNRIMALNEG